ncbi:26S proteasome non-ATPase regulatory subunit 4 -like protein [Gossypium arboreum]|uniref:26S proteasome non-ATPase regulatory subunit 4-like protein n=1 Tax=Gossypium arboreum TaxID=29729 RepID=A0A0B0PR94_GOSAR|nr:26S proteasome non-ATPase regulatory subunit 4 -like protein [Gossypium arboreum]
MVLEATMICIDNSEWMRNGDYSPSRFQAQADAVSLICGAKTQSNPENTVGILTMAGKGVRVLTTPTSDLGKILACMHGNLPIKYEKKVLEMIGKKLKKNSVALDIVDFGEDEDGKPDKLEALLASVNNNDSSHIVHVPPGQNALSDVLISTPVFTGDGEGGGGFAAHAASVGVTNFDFGVDPNIDPELALALRVSMEEERARQEAAAKKAAEESSNPEKEEEVQPQSDSQHATEQDEDDALLKHALALSMNIPGSDSSAGDAEMSEATNDQELAMDFTQG